MPGRISIFPVDRSLLLGQEQYEHGSSVDLHKKIPFIFRGFYDGYFFVYLIICEAFSALCVGIFAGNTKVCSVLSLSHNVPNNPLWFPVVCNTDFEIATLHKVG